MRPCPPRLDYVGQKRPRLVIQVRPGEHRVMGLRVDPAALLAEPRLYREHAIPLLPADDLRRLPLENGTTSLFYEDGILEGHVKGAWKPWETLFIGWWCLGRDGGHGQGLRGQGQPLVHQPAALVSPKLGPERPAGVSEILGLEILGWRLRQTAGGFCCRHVGIPVADLNLFPKAIQ